MTHSSSHNEAKIYQECSETYYWSRIFINLIVFSILDKLSFEFCSGFWMLCIKERDTLNELDVFS